jgi:hypothetical protein
MLFKYALATLVAFISLVAGVPVEKRHTPNETVTYLGSQGRILCMPISSSSKLQQR